MIYWFIEPRLPISDGVVEPQADLINNAIKKLNLAFVVEPIHAHQVFYDLGTELHTLSRAQ